MRTILDINDKHDYPIKWTCGEDNYIEEMQTSQKQQTHTPEPLLHKRKAIFTTIKKTYSVWYITELCESLILFNLRYSFTSLTTLSQEDEFQGGGVISSSPK